MKEDAKRKAHPQHDLLRGRNMKDVILGANDALVSTVALVAGVSAAAVTNRVVIIAAVAEIVAGAVSMGISSYLSHKSQEDLYKKELERERREIDEVPEEERDEVREIYREKGFDGEKLDMVVDVITNDRDTWLRVMMEEELGFSESAKDSANGSGVRVSIAFMIFGFIPVVPFLFMQTREALPVAIGATLTALTFIGMWKSKYSNRSIMRNVVEMVMLASSAAAISYALGTFIATM